MYEFVANQVFGIDGLVSLSNIVFLVAFSARDVLKLRILSFFGEAVILPYYYFQHETLWAPLEHGIHGRECGSHRGNRLGATTVRFQREGRTALSCRLHLYREKRILEIGQPCPVGRLYARGRHPRKRQAGLRRDCPHLRRNRSYIASETRMAFRPGQLIGDVSVYSGLSSPVDIVARGYGTVVKWDWRQLVEFTASRPALRAKLLTMVSADLAAKLREITVAISGLVVERPAAR
jgi:hypothetical protein